MKRFIRDCIRIVAGSALAMGAAPFSSAQTLDDYAKAAGIPIYELEILSEIPHDTGSWTQGLVYEGGFFYESTGQIGKSTLQKLNARTGELLQKISLDIAYFGEGLAILGDELIQLTWTEGKAFIYNKKDLTKKGTFQYNTEGWGLTTIGKTFIMTDGSNRLFFRDSDDFALDYALQVRLGQDNLRLLNELEYARDAVYANILTADYIAEIDPATGDVTGLVNCTVLREQIGAHENEKPLNGIAYDPATENFYVTGKLWPKIYCVKFVRKF